MCVCVGGILIFSETIPDTAGDIVTNFFLYLAFLEAKKKMGMREDREEGQSVALTNKVIILLFGGNYPHQSYRDAQLPKGIW